MTLFNCVVRPVATATTLAAPYADRVTDADPAAGANRVADADPEANADPVADAQPPPAVRVGVLLARDPGDVGEWLREAAAFDAARADALWVEAASQSALDPLAVAAALAAVTFRAHLFVSVPDIDPASPAFLRQLSTVDRVSRGRVRVVSDIATSPLAGVPVVRYVSDDPPIVEDTDRHRWSFGPAPDSRADWQAARVAAVESGMYGLVVAAGPRLLDLLRNPDDHGDRRDLQLTVG